MILCLAAAQASAQAQPLQQRQQLAALQQAAVETDPRFRQLALQQAQSRLRADNIATERRPSVDASAQAQYQSDVPMPPAILPGGRPLFAPPKATYDAFVRIDQRLVDPTIAPRMAAERAQLAEGQARVRTALFALRQEVNDAFFAAALLQERAGALSAGIADLDARLRETQARVREGAALAADAASVEAALLQRRQDEAELHASRRAALARLSSLVDRAIGDTDVLDVPDVRGAVAQARSAPAAARARPEFDQFARTRERLDRQRDVAGAQEQPRLLAFARAGYGRPGLNFISDQFETYALGGIQVQWKAVTWGVAAREREALALQREIADADEAAFTRAMTRSADTDLTTIDRLAGMLDLDDRIVALREEIARIAELRFGESAVTAAEYVDRSTELLQARFARAEHRVQLAQAGARFLTTLGLEVR